MSFDRQTLCLSQEKTGTMTRRRSKLASSRTKKTDRQLANSHPNIFVPPETHSLPVSRA